MKKTLQITLATVIGINISLVYFIVGQNITNKQLIKLQHNNNITIKYQQTQIECLAENIYHEARGESIKGQKAVANVTINRMKSKKFPNDICGVVFQKKQFSWTNSGKKKIDNHDEYEKIKKLATQIYESKESIVGNAMYYHTDKVRLVWTKNLKKVANIGSHIFYEN